MNEKMINHLMFSIPNGLSTKPVEQLSAYLGKPVPEDKGFVRSDYNAYRLPGEIQNNLLIQKGLITENGLVLGVIVVWQTPDPEKLLTLIGQLHDLLDQYKYTILKEEKNLTSLLINDRIVDLIGVKEAGRTFYFTLSLY
jgi:hypothetical protein